MTPIRIPGAAASLARSIQLRTYTCRGRPGHTRMHAAACRDRSSSFGSTCKQLLRQHTRTDARIGFRYDSHYIGFGYGSGRDACVRTDKIVYKYVLLRCRRLLIHRVRQAGAEGWSWSGAREKYCYLTGG